MADVQNYSDQFFSSSPDEKEGGMWATLIAGLVGTEEGQGLLQGLLPSFLTGGSTEEAPDYTLYILGGFMVLLVIVLVVVIATMGGRK